MKSLTEEEVLEDEISVFDFKDEIDVADIKEMTVSISSESGIYPIRIGECHPTDIEVEDIFPPYVRLFLDEDKKNSIDIYQVSKIKKNETNSYTIEAGVLRQFYEPFIVNLDICV